MRGHKRAPRVPLPPGLSTWSPKPQDRMGLRRGPRKGQAGAAIPALVPALRRPDCAPEGSALRLAVDSLVEAPVLESGCLPQLVVFCILIPR